MLTFPCPYLQSTVVLADERAGHIAQAHPDLLPEYLDRIEQTLAAPDEVRCSTRMSNARLFYRWFDDVRKGKHVAVVVMSESEPGSRHWIVTAYITRRLANGVVEWKRS